MIKGITFVHPIASAGALVELSALLLSLGFEPGKGWQDATGEGASLLAPVGNLELVTGRIPASPELLVETTQLDHIHGAIYQHLLTTHRTEDIRTILSDPESTHWNSRLFTFQLDQALTIGFWQSENPLHNRPDAIEGDLSAIGMSFAIVTTRWNAVITDRLLQGALDALHRSGAAKQDITIVRVPGAWEIPSAARTLAEMRMAQPKSSESSTSETKKYDAIITLGCLLRGETAHYEAIYNEVSRGIGQSQQETGTPHAFGVLTCETLEQALDRAGLKAGNKGFESAIAAIEMVSIQRKLATQS